MQSENILLKMGERMNIPNPKAKYNERVMVLNYRYKPSKWEEGECRGVSYGSGFGENFSWAYDVYIYKGKGYYIYVGDKSIRSIK